MPNTQTQPVVQRLTRLSTSIAQCSTQSAAYARCIVTHSEDLKKDTCLNEFNQFRDCVKNALKKK